MTNENNTTINQDINTAKTYAHFKILAELGRGGMGCVYKAFDTKLERTVALKLLISQTQVNEKQVQRFIVEARATAKLIHPNIVRVYEIGNEKGIAFFTMDCINGASLKEMIKSKKLTLRKGLILMKKVSEAMYYAHQNGIIHRDLKPANVMVDEKGEPYVMDFGLAKVLDSDKKLTKTGTVMGTPFYMPPEQAEGKHRAIDQRSDIYSLGAMVYEIVTGRIPHYSNSTLTLLKKITQDPVQAPSTLTKNRKSKDLDYICLKALAKKQENRYENANELAQDLDSFIKGEPIAGATKGLGVKTYITAILTIIVLIGAIHLGFITQKKPDKKITQKNPDKIAGFTFIKKETYSAGGQTHTVKLYLHDKTGIEFVLIPSGTFMMGSNEGEPDEKPVHRVKLDSFLMSKTEVTQEVYKRFMGSPWHGKKYVKEGPNYPATYVTWTNAKAFCDKVGLKLPTEAQWEYACRAGTSSKYYWGNIWDNTYLWHKYNAYKMKEKYAHLVGKKKPNAFGLYDMPGNVWEWCRGYKRVYSSAAVTNPADGSHNSRRVIRGGGWRYGSSFNRSRSAFRASSSLGVPQLLWVSGGLRPHRFLAGKRD